MNFTSTRLNEYNTTNDKDSLYNDSFRTVVVAYYKVPRGIS